MWPRGKGVFLGKVKNLQHHAHLFIAVLRVVVVVYIYIHPHITTIESATIRARQLFIYEYGRVCIT